MTRVDLNVPFEEKELAKKLGARWDPDKKVWYAPSGTKLAEFEKWVVKPPQFTFRADSYYITKAYGGCWACSGKTLYIGLGVPSGFLANQPIDDEFDGMDDEELESSASYRAGVAAGWFVCHFSALLYWVRDISDAVHCHMRQHSRNYRVSFSQTAGMAYWMNHCDHCGVKQGDFKDYGEPDGLFRDYGRFTIHKVLEPLSVNCDEYLSDKEIDEYLGKKPCSFY